MKPIILNARSSTFYKPQVVGVQNINQELPPCEVYSGMYARVTIRFFGHSNSGNKGIGCGHSCPRRSWGLPAASARPCACSGGSCALRLPGPRHHAALGNRQRHQPHHRPAQPM